MIWLYLIMIIVVNDGYNDHSYSNNDCYNEWLMNGLVRWIVNDGWNDMVIMISNDELMVNGYNG